jgi:hypothetical protein
MEADVYFSETSVFDVPTFKAENIKPEGGGCKFFKNVGIFL